LESEVVQEVEALLGREAVAELDFEALEMALRHGTLRLAARAMEQRLNADTSNEVASQVPCRCGGKAHFAGRRSKQFQSVLGPLRLERAYYHCSSCGDGCFPRDKHLGIENTSLSPALTRMTGTVGAMVSFQEGSELLQELAGIDVATKQVERTAEAILALLTARIRPLFWLFLAAFNPVGIVDLILDYYHAIKVGLPALAGQLGATYAIPILYVPLLMITHVVAFYLLLRPQPKAVRALAAAAAAS